METYIIKIDVSARHKTLAGPPIFLAEHNLSVRTYPDSKTLRKFVPNFLAAVGINSPKQLTFTLFRKLWAHLK